MSSLLSSAGNRMTPKPSKAKMSKARLFALRNGNTPAGFELRDDQDCRAALIDGIVIAVSVGEDFTFKSKVDKQQEQEHDNDNNDNNDNNNDNNDDVEYVTPKFPWPSKIDRVPIEWNESNCASSSSTETAETTGETTTKITTEIRSELRAENECDGEFAQLEGRVIELIREAIDGCDAFVEKHCGDYVAFDYVSMGDGVFDDWRQWPKKSRRRLLQLVRRECRGLLVCSSTGCVLARRFHKFFNVGERPETRADVLPWHDSACEISVKLDGSLVSPLLVGEQLAWATRSALCESVEQHAGPELRDFCEHWIRRGYTPLFEWMQAGAAVGVIEHERDSLSLLAIRHMGDGSYVPRDELERLADDSEWLTLADSVRGGGGNGGGVRALVDRVVSQWHDAEGVVLHWPARSLFVKVKSNWHVSLALAAKRGGQARHGSALIELLKERCSLHAVPAAMVWQDALRVSVSDDNGAACARLLRAADQDGDELLRFFEAVRGGVARLRADFVRWGQRVGSLRERSTLLARLSERCGWTEQMLAAYANGKRGDGERMLGDALNRLRHERDFDALAALLGGGWHAASATMRRCALLLGDDGDALPELVAAAARMVDVGSLGPMDRRPKALSAWVLTKYLPRKISNHLGVPLSALNDNTVVCVPADYRPDEGKIKGLWERFRKHGVVDLRIDLQDRRDHFDAHFGDSDHALWLVQYGPNACSSRSSRAARATAAVGSFAGVLMATDTDFRFGELRSAVERSFEQRCIVKLERSSVGVDNASSSSSSPPVAAADNIDQIWCDLDGVLADFDAGIEALTGRSAAQLSTDDMWRRIKGAGNFFESLNMMADGAELWQRLVALAEQRGASLGVLSGVSTGTFAKHARRQKLRWVARHLGADVRVETCSSQEKARRCARPGALLVDDRLSTCEQWRALGGVAVHHVTAPRTVWHLNALLLADQSEELRKARACCAELVDGGAQRRRLVSQEPLAIKWIDASTKLAVVQRFLSALDDSTRVAFDCEWRPDEMRPANAGRSKSAAALVQLALSSTRTVYVLDMLAPHRTARTCLMRALADPTLLKMCFGAEEDAPRLLAALGARSSDALAPLLDIQAAWSMLDEGAQDNNRPSLTRVAGRLFGDAPPAEVKSKSVQACDWEQQRPPSDALLRYAALDAALLLDIADCLASPDSESLCSTLQCAEQSVSLSRAALKRYTHTAGVAASGATAERQDGDVSTIRHVAVFLDDASKALLLGRVAPRHANVRADHVTLLYRLPISLDALPEAIVGASVSVHVLAGTEVDRDGVQAVRVAFDAAASEFVVESGVPHITISIGARARAGDAVHLLLAAETPPPHVEPSSILCTLSGRVGVAVGSGDIDKDDGDSDALATLPRSIAKSLLEFLSEAQCGARLPLPPTLSAAERLAVHRWAESNALSSQSEGSKRRGASDRRVIVTKPKHFDAAAAAAAAASAVDAQPLRILNADTMATLHDDDDRQQRGGAAASKSKKRCERLFSIDEVCALVVEPSNDDGRHRVVDSQGRIEFASDNCCALARRLSGGGDKLAIVWRGLSGMGKSRSIEWLCSKLAVDGDPKTVSVSSADHFFDAGAGMLSRRKMKTMSAAEIYRSCFSERLLPAAHDDCFARFEAALYDDSVRTVMVDNTNSALTHYGRYVDAARRRGIAADVLELVCASAEQLEGAGRRARHRVPMQVRHRMWSQWQADERAVRIEPYFGGGDGAASSSSSTATTTQSVAKWLEEHKFVHHSKKRKATHLLMAPTKPDSVRFAYVPAAYRREFFRVYAADEAPKYVCELHEAQQFRFYVDFDDPSGQSDASTYDVVALARVAQDAVRKWSPTMASEALTLVTGSFEDAKCGFHIKMPNVVLRSTRDAETLRRSVCSALQRTMSIDRDWDSVLDAHVYTQRSLRMFGSLKPPGGRRRHSLLAVVDAQGNVDEPERRRLEQDTPALLELLSICQ
jgi:RNA ligase/3'-5' exonuclease/Prim-pol 4/R3H domain